MPSIAAYVRQRHPERSRTATVTPLLHLERQLLKRQVLRLVPFCFAGLLVVGCSGDLSDGDGGVNAGSTLDDSSVSSASSSTLNQPSLNPSSTLNPSSPPITVEPPADSDVSFAVLPADQAVLLYAESLLTARCMGSVGFPYEILDYTATVDRMQQSADDAQRSQFPYVASIEGMPYSPRAEEVPFDPNDSYIRGLDENTLIAYGDALQGDIQDRVEVSVLGSSAATPRAGCTSEARIALYGSLEDALTSVILSGNLAPTVHARARSDPAVLDALGSWAQCMAGVGFTFADFGEARAAAGARPDDADRIARANDECTIETNLSATYTSAYEAARSAVIEANIEQFRASAEARTSAVMNAQQLLTQQ